MSMKKLISLALCLVIALAFAAGCKKKEEAVTPAPDAAMAPMSSAAAPAEVPAAPVEAPAEAPVEAPAAK